MPPLSSLSGSLDLPFAEQIEFFRHKLDLPTRRWNDLWKAQHDRYFVVAGAEKADLLADLHATVRKAIDTGTTLETFRKDFRGIVEERGWHGWTGEGTKAGEAWRTRVIYETNLRTSYAAGRHAQLTDPELLARRPYWKYIHADGVLHPREQHLAWNGLVLHHTHPFWKTHYPPNGWGCGCTVVAVRAPQAGDKTEPPPGWDQVDAKTGEPPGVDKGWGYAPGASISDELRSIVETKAAKLPEELATAFVKEANAVLPSPVFVPQKTAKAAAQWAVQHNLADQADYTGIKPEVANAWNQSLSDHLQAFPELRKNQAFVGSAQAHIKQHVASKRAKVVEKAVKQGIPVAIAERWAASLVKVPRVSGNTYALSISDYSPGVSVNTKYGRNLAIFVRSLERDVKNGWHPVGCNTIRSVADHEFGHQLDDLLRISLDSEVRRLYKEAMARGMKPSVSGYAAKNVSEFVAECWAEFLNNPSPRPTAKAVGEIIRSRYGQRHG
jgi:hypothetical protein